MPNSQEVGYHSRRSRVIISPREIIIFSIIEFGIISCGKQTNPSGFVCLLYFRGYDIMGLLNEIAEKLLKNFLSLKEDDWIEWIAQPNDWQDDCDKFNGCYFMVK